MRSSKRYSTQSFTKKVDHEGGSRRESKNITEPAVCLKCGSVHIDRRWVSKSALRESEKHAAWRPPTNTVCPACDQIENGIVGGYLTVDGGFFKQHQTEIENLIANEAERELEDNPLARIMSKDATDGGLLVRTTNENLAERFGRALESAYSGKLTIDFSHENKVARVHWSRD